MTLVINILFILTPLYYYHSILLHIIRVYVPNGRSDADSIG